MQPLVGKDENLGSQFLGTGFWNRCGTIIGKHIMAISQSHKGFVFFTGYPIKSYSSEGHMAVCSVFSCVSRISQKWDPQKGRTFEKGPYLF